MAAVALLIGVGWATVWAQGLGPNSSGSLAELTAEVRQLRVVIQDAGRSQAQMQAVGISLTAQLNRLNQVSARLDKTEEELRAASARTREAAEIMTAIQSSLARAISAEERAHGQRGVQTAKDEVDRFLEEENRIRQRQTELMAAFRADEARWLELVAKLDEIIKR
jgi:uncharacterized protein YaaN involved in tellurite resistance